MVDVNTEGPPMGAHHSSTVLSCCLQSRDFWSTSLFGSPFFWKLLQCRNKCVAVGCLKVSASRLLPLASTICVILAAEFKVHRNQKNWEFQKSPYKNFRVLCLCNWNSAHWLALAHLAECTQKILLPSLVWNVCERKINQFVDFSLFSQWRRVFFLFHHDIWGLFHILFE